jgi:H+/Cl- antiporter ClcA
MAPLVLVTTLITHLFGGSAGREGTAVQMGGGLAGWFAHTFRLAAEYRRVVLMAGVAAGFGAVFGTPLAGAVFAMEVLVIGRVRYDALIPCLLAGVLGDLSCSAWGIAHTHYHIDLLPASAGFGAGRVDPTLLAKSGVAGIAFGLASLLFAESAHGLQSLFRSRIGTPWLRPVLGGLLVIALTWLVGTRSYLGLGVSSPVPGDVTILSCFTPGGATAWSWFWKLLFTVVTLSSGFKGGEVTPLFFIGAALGNALSGPFHAPVDLFAGLGFVAVFAGASNTPLACTLMGIELFGSDSALYLATACFLAYLFSGHSGIYGAQRVGTAKLSGEEPLTDITLTELRKRR